MYTSNHVSLSLTTSNRQCLLSLSSPVYLAREHNVLWRKLTVEYDDVYLKTGHTDCTVRVFLYPHTDSHRRERHSTVCCKSAMWPFVTS